MNNWKKTTLGEVCNFRRGHDLPKYDMQEGMVPVAGSNGIIGYHDKQTNIEPCITIGRSGNVGTPYYYEKCWAHNTVLYIDDYKGNDPKFIYYFIKTLNLGNYSGGSAVPTLNRNHIHPIEVYFPIDIDEQKRIADVLSALDDKIEINNKINENLEAQAQAIFKQWFVDFEFPDQEGKPYKTNGGKFIDSELGEIPVGWKVGKIRDIVLSTIGGDWGKEQKIDNYISEVYCIRGADINDIIKGNKGKMPTRFILEKNYNSKKLGANDIVIEISGGSPTQSTGRVALITDALLNRYDKSMICTNFCRAIKPLENYSYFIFYYWRYLYDLNTMFSYENGTTGIKNLDINGVLDNENVALPNIELLNCFNNYVLNIMKTIFNNGLESENLSEIRDSLLPKLMSGEIRV